MNSYIDHLLAMDHFRREIDLMFDSGVTIRGLIEA